MGDGHVSGDFSSDGSSTDDRILEVCFALDGEAELGESSLKLGLISSAGTDGVDKDFCDVILFVEHVFDETYGGVV